MTISGKRGKAQKKSMYGGYLAWIGSFKKGLRDEKKCSKTCNVDKFVSAIFATKGFVHKHKKKEAFF